MSGWAQWVYIISCCQTWEEELQGHSSIGDGMNNVSMIQVTHVGVGISGVEYTPLMT